MDEERDNETEMGPGGSPPGTGGGDSWWGGTRFEMTRTLPTAADMAPAA